ncbi:MAG: MFS transporter [Rhodospirillaceae bacterium]|nr:MFS transporter [Rhodospirillaceae bacterium]
MQPSRKSRPRGTPPTSRNITLSALDSVLRKGRNLAESLEVQPAFAALAGRDRAFTRLLLLTTLRRLGQIDAAIDSLLEKPLPARRAGVRDILRLGAAQLLFLDTAPHAAVDSAVKQTAKSPHAALKGLVNALLRRLSRESSALLAAQDAARLNTRDWLWQSWSESYGEDNCRAIAEAHMAEPAIDLNFKHDIENWAARLGGEPLPCGILRLTRAGAVEALDGYGDGAWWVQDFAAALPARLLGDVSGQTIIEIGAAPGGKTAQLASAGAKMQALDRSPTRLARLRENMARLGLQAEIIEADGQTWRPSTLADGVLLDAPCSATGTIRRHPEIMWRRAAKDVAELAEKQMHLLHAALEMVKPGGLVVYAVCSLEPAEGPELIEQFLKRSDNTERLALGADEIGGLDEALTPAGELRTLPCHLAERGGMDGFYAARLRRTF